MAPNARRRSISGLPATQSRHDLVGVEQRDEAIAPAQAAQRALDVGLLGGVLDLEDVVERLEPDDVVDQEAHVSASAGDDQRATTATGAPDRRAEQTSGVDDRQQAASPGGPA